MIRFKKSSKQMHLQDIVREDAVPNIAYVTTYCREGRTGVIEYPDNTCRFG